MTVKHALPLLKGTGEGELYLTVLNNMGLIKPKEKNPPLCYAHAAPHPCGSAGWERII